MRVWKIGEEDCPVCAEMGLFDSGLLLSMGLELMTITLDEVLSWPIIAEFVKETLLNDDGTVDIPIYVVCSALDGRPLSAVSGRNTKSELKRKLSQVVYIQEAPYHD